MNNAAQTIAIEDVESENTLFQPKEARRTALVKLLTAIPLLGNLVVLTLAMGGVIPVAYEWSAFITFVATGVLLIAPFSRDGLERVVGDKVVLVFSLGIIALVAYGVVMLFSLKAFVVPHPLLGETSKLRSFEAGMSVAMSFLYFLANYLLFQFAIEYFKAATIRVWILRLAWGVALIALSHWFYDNGKLFWLFEPNNVMPQTRARWPFVNPNHLGAACLLFLAVATVSLRESLELLERSVLTERDNRLGAVLKHFSHRRVQHRCWEVLSTTLLIITLLLTLFGSLSRGSWLGLACMTTLLLVALVARNFRNFLSMEHSKRKPSLSERYRMVVRKVLSVLLVTAIAAATLIFLQGRGSELVQERVIYGLTKSKDDLRWLLYSESEQILASNWLTGIGLGQWSEEFRRLQLFELSGYEPQYLHSDPYQLLIEIGAPASILFCLAMAAGVVVRMRHRTITQEFWILTSAIIGFLVSSLVDFPFRIPLICVLFAGVLALWTARADQRHS